MTTYEKLRIIAACTVLGVCMMVGFALLKVMP